MTESQIRAEVADGLDKLERMCALANISEFGRQLWALYATRRQADDPRP